MGIVERFGHEKEHIGVAQKCVYEFSLIVSLGKLPAMNQRPRFQSIVVNGRILCWIENVIDNPCQTGFNETRI